MPVSPLQAEVTVGHDRILPPTSAEWTVTVTDDEKFSSATILGATAKVFRHEKTGKFQGEILLPVEKAEDAAEDAEDGFLKIRPQLHDCESLFAAQKMCELRIRDWLAQCRPELLRALDKDAHEAAVQEQGPDPF